MSVFSHNLKTDIRDDITELNFLAQQVNLTLNLNSDTINSQKWPLHKRQIKTQIREQFMLHAMTQMAQNWQSPSYLHSLHSEAGLKTGKIKGNITDYTRDHHSEALAYEQQFTKEILGVRGLLPIECFLTQSGMAALTTIVLFLLRTTKLTRPMLIGQRSYFQNQEIIRSLKHVEIISFDETDLPNLTHLIYIKKPSVIWLDSLTNHQEVICPDLAQIIKTTISVSQVETYCVIDNSGLGPLLNVKKILPRRLGKVKVLGFESLNKLYQFGMDRTTAGLVWGLPRDAVALFYSRLHSGTNISDVAARMLPYPNKRILLKRINRLTRNALLLATTLKSLNKNTSLIQRVWYPDQGPILTLELKRTFWSKRYQKSLISKIISQAKQQQVQITAGTSFGLDTTRIYTVAMDSIYTKPFFRIAVGTEDCQEFQKVISLIKATFTKR